MQFAIVTPNPQKNISSTYCYAWLLDNYTFISVKLQLMKNNELKRISRIDPLTGLKNRHYFFDILKPRVGNKINSLWMEKNGSNKRKPSDLTGYGVISIDIDHFKRVNDNYGHDSGDMVWCSSSSVQGSVKRSGRMMWLAASGVKNLS